MSYTGMDIQTPTSKERSRTYWTAAMERFFIDLMLEQVQQGNRIGHTFNKQAWNDMLAMFNAKFFSQYDKDALKSRYSNLWKQFNDVKTLLGQNGFSWDASREMVVAEDYVWNSHARDHPDVRLYKTKAVQNFNALCLIFEYAYADGRYSLSSHDSDFDDEVLGINIACTSNADSATHERRKIEWTAEMEQCFVDLILDQMCRGRKVGNVLNKQAWEDILCSLNSRFFDLGPQGKRILKHRYRKLLKNYRDVKIILQNKGFSWDEDRSMVVADDKTWIAYIKAHPHVRAYRKMVLPKYSDLATIFSSETDADGDTDLQLDLEPSSIESNAVSCSDRTRTRWNRSMDQCFINLMLDHVQRGNRFREAFSCQAWKEMVASFNAKFQSCYDKEVVKNRYKHFKKLFHCVKALLEMEGFSWDEKREAVIAEDHVWDEYVKEHPEARPYRTKSIPGYQKLCIIFGQEHSDRRYSQLAQGAENGEMVLLINGKSTTEPLDMEWQPSMRRYFIDLLLEQMSEGNNIDDEMVDSKAWDRIADSFNHKFGIACDKQFLKNYYNSLLKECETTSSLLSHAGFSWDAGQETVVADDAVWDTKSKERQDIMACKGKILVGYLDLCKLYKNRVLAGAAKQSMEIVSLPDQSRKRKNPEWCDLKQSKSQKAEEIPSKNMEMEGKGYVLVKQDVADSTSIESVIDALQAMEDLDEEILLDACDLMEDERKAKTFLALDATLRKKWLLRKLGSHESKFAQDASEDTPSKDTATVATDKVTE